jgi:serine protease Do
MNRTQSFLALLAVVAASIVFGMIVGGPVNAPPVVFAAPVATGDAPVLEDGAPHRPLAPAMATDAVGRLDFADVAATALPAVVSITNTQVRTAEAVPNPHGRAVPDNLFEELFERFREPQRPDVVPDPDASEEPRERRENSAGSGFLISGDGYIMSNHHVVDNADRLVVTFQDGTQYDAEIIGTDPGIDFALLKIEPDGRALPYLPLGDSSSVRVGEWALAIGNPLEFSHSVTVGVVSALDRTVPLRGTDVAVAQFIQTDAAINLGNSGGPLLNAAGEVIGINTAINRERLAEGIGFALPIDAAMRSRDQILANGTVRRGILGVTMNADGIDEDAMRYYGLPDRNGVIVAEVREDGPAADAGIEPEDIIRRIDGKVVRGNSDLIAQIASRQPGDTVEIDLFRDGRTRTVSATLAERVLRGGRVDMRTGDEPEESSEPEPVAATGLGLTVETYSPEALGTVLPRGMTPRGIDGSLQGALITYVDLASPAEDKGLVQGLVIIAVDGEPVASADDWRERMEGLRPGDVVQLRVRSPIQGAVDRFVFLTVPRVD